MNYLKQWNFMRLLRLVIGIAILIQGIQTGEWIWIAAGAVFSLMPLLNIGCCGTTTCAPTRSKPGRSEETISYEEVK